MAEALFQIGIKALIQNESGALLLRCNSSGRWDIPGGRMEPGETIHAALARELSDEIGIYQLSVTELFDTILSNITVSDGENEYGLMLILYKVSIPKNTTIVLGEGETFEWVSPDTAGERIANKYSEEFRAKLATL